MTLTCLAPLLPLPPDVDEAPSGPMVKSRRMAEACRMTGTGRAA